MNARTARATARVARTIHGDVENRQLGIVRATLAVALAVLGGRPGIVPLTKTSQRARLTEKRNKAYTCLAIDEVRKNMTTAETSIATDFEIVIGLEVHSQLLTKSK